MKGSAGGNQETRSLWFGLPWLLIAATPIVFALATWDPVTPLDPVRTWIRVYSVPVLVIELLVIGHAAASGFEPLKMLLAQPRWAQAALSILFVVALYTALVVAIDRPLAMARTVMWLVHLLFGLSVAFEAAANRELVIRIFWPAVVAGLCSYVLLLILYVAIIPDATRFDWMHLWLAVGNIRQVGFYSAVGSAAALGVAAFQPRPIARAMSLAAAAVMFGLSFWSGTRGSIIAVWAACGVALVVFRSLPRIRTLGMLVITTLVGALLSLLHVVPNGHYGIARIAISLGHQGVENVSSGRLSMWAGTYESILHRPLFGYGESQFRSVVPEAQGAFNHPHNVVLQIAFQWGIVGTLCVIALTALLVRELFAASSADPKIHLPAFLVAMSLLTMALFEGTLYHAYPTAMIAAAIAVATGVGRLNGR